MSNQETISWLLTGDVSIQYQTYRDLLGKDKPSLRKRIESEGWGKRFLSMRQQNKHWGRGFYQPKWTSSHYTLLDLRNLNLSPQNKVVRETLAVVLQDDRCADGGVYPIGNPSKGDVCINGMVLNYACYFKMKDQWLKSIVDFLLHEKMPDGGFNCQSNRKGAVHSSLHSTLSVLEGILEYKGNGYTHRLQELQTAQGDSIEFMLMHKLFRSDKTGAIINEKFLKFHYPCRWYYDILRALDYFRAAEFKYDPRLDEAIDIVIKKRTLDGKWKLAAQHPGAVHFDMEAAGKPSRWTTLRAMRVLKHFNALP